LVTPQAGEFLLSCVDEARDGHRTSSLKQESTLRVHIAAPHDRRSSRQSESGVACGVPVAVIGILQRYGLATLLDEWLTIAARSSVNTAAKILGAPGWPVWT
jgi:hypothetical protein